MTEEIIKISNNTEIKVTHHKYGDIESKTPYVAGKKHGMKTEWYERGQKEREVMWKNGKKHGMEIEWWANGKKYAEITHRDGLWHGVWTEWREDGTKWQEETRKDGELHGLETQWYEDGKKKEEVYYSHDEEIGGMKWDEEGNVTEINFHPSSKQQQIQIQAKNQSTHLIHPPTYIHPSPK